MRQGGKIRDAVEDIGRDVTTRMPGPEYGVPLLPVALPVKQPLVQQVDDHVVETKRGVDNGNTTSDAPSSPALPCPEPKSREVRTTQAASPTTPRKSGRVRTVPAKFRDGAYDVHLK